jgi:hypothetical protein
MATTSVAILGITKPAHALDFKCVEISRYRYLLQIFNDDPNAFSSYFGLDRNQFPDPSTCRALVVTGAVQPGDAGALVDHLIRGNGWLATLYLSFDSVDTDEARRIGQVIHGFWLKTRVLRVAPFRYEPDFLPDQNGAARMDGNDVPAQDPETLTNGLRAFLMRRDLSVEIDPCRNECAGSCPLLWAAGASRLAAATETAAGTRPAQISERATDISGPPLATARAENRDESIPPHGPDIFSLAAMPGPVEQQLQQECTAELAAASGLEARLGTDVDNFAGARAGAPRADQVLDEIRRMRTAAARLQRCVASAYERSRLTSFARFCGTNCDRKSALDNLAKGMPAVPEIADARTSSDQAPAASETDHLAAAAPTRLVYRREPNQSSGEFTRTAARQWVETTPDKIVHQFCSVAESSTSVVLYDKSRASYVRASIPLHTIFYLPAGERVWRALYNILDTRR